MAKALALARSRYHVPPQRVKVLTRRHISGADSLLLRPFQERVYVHFCVLRYSFAPHALPCRSFSALSLDLRVCLLIFVVSCVCVRVRVRGRGRARVCEDTS